MTCGGDRGLVLRRLRVHGREHLQNRRFVAAGATAASNCGRASAKRLVAARARPRLKGNRAMRREIDSLLQFGNGLIQFAHAGQNHAKELWPSGDLGASSIPFLAH